jgi:hypothetical protein
MKHISELKSFPDSQWAYRHRVPHHAYTNGKVIPVEVKTSKRLAREFEQAVKARGAAAKREFENA